MTQIKAYDKILKALEKAFVSKAHQIAALESIIDYLKKP